MTISVGDKLPDAVLLEKVDGKIGPVELRKRIGDAKVVIFGLPGALTPTCDSAHLPSFIRTAEQFRENGVKEIICVAVNDAHVMQYWAETSGGQEAGITFLADGDGSFTKAIGLDYDLPAVGFYGRSKRYAMLVENGVVNVLNLEKKSGVCELTVGEALLEKI